MAETDDSLVIRGRTLNPHALVRSLEDDRLLADRADRFTRAAPFPHLVVDGLFDETLLDLVDGDFAPDGRGRTIETARQLTRRSTGTQFGFATETYLNLVNSARFVAYLSALTGIAGLIPDTAAVGGGLHETPAGGRFDVHVDFNLHRHTMLANALVLITYLNRDWHEDYGGALELWDGEGCAERVWPVFGRSILMRHGPRSFHGHPAPLTPPEGRTRRSIVSYYYVNPPRLATTLRWRTSEFLGHPRSRWTRGRALVHRLAGGRPA